MIVQGIVISDKQMQALLQRMKISVFVAADIQATAELNEITKEDGLSMRVADRLIQREKKAGNILFSARQWMWVGE